MPSFALNPFVASALGPLVAGLVWRARLLTTSGAIAAAALGSAAALAGFDWMLLLLTFFGSSVALGRLGRTTKQQRSANVIEKSGPRDATQVMANGALFGLGAVLTAAGGAPDWVPAAALGALAAATADTWGTEIGMLARQAPRSILTWEPLEPGMSGGVTAQGLLATAAGATVPGLIAAMCAWPAAVVVAAAFGGLAGAMADSLLGATVQARRRSARTNRLTERLTDADGTPTVPAGGVDWMDNDAVNGVATLVGAGAAHALHFMLVASRTL